MKNWRVENYQEHNNTLPVQSSSIVLSWPMNTLFYSAFHGIVGTPFCNYELFKLNTYDVFPHKCDAQALMRGGFLKQVYAALTTGFHRRAALVPWRIQDASYHNRPQRLLYGTPREAAVTYVHHIISESNTVKTTSVLTASIRKFLIQYHKVSESEMGYHVHDTHMSMRQSLNQCDV
jgi:hypothetical protein